MSKFTADIPRPLLRDLDSLTEEKGGPFKTRAEVLRAAIRAFLKNPQQ